MAHKAPAGTGPGDSSSSKGVESAGSLIVGSVKGPNPAAPGDAALSSLSDKPTPFAPDASTVVSCRAIRASEHRETSDRPGCRHQFFSADDRQARGSQARRGVTAGDAGPRVD